MVKYYWIWLVLMIASSCVKDKPNPDYSQLPNATNQGAWVLNEGIYGNNNADFSFIDFESDSVYNNLYKYQTGYSLGDIAQDMQEINGQLWISVTNSNKIVVVDAHQMDAITEIKSITSPRYMQNIGDSVVIVSSYSDNHLYFIRTKTFEIFKTIEVNYSGTEHMVQLGDYVYVSNWNEVSPLVYQIKVPDFTLATTIILPYKASHDVVPESDTTLWILTGNAYKQIASHLLLFNTKTNTVVKQFAFPTDAEPLRLCRASSSGDLYFIEVNYTGSATHNGIYRMQHNESGLPTQPYIPANTHSYFYALSIHPITGDLFVSDANGFNQRSTIFQYSQQGALIKRYTSGLGSNRILFR